MIWPGQSPGSGPNRVEQHVQRAVRSRVVIAEYRLLCVGIETKVGCTIQEVIDPLDHFDARQTGPDTCARARIESQMRLRLRSSEVDMRGASKAGRVPIRRRLDQDQHLVLADRNTAEHAILIRHTEACIAPTRTT